MMNRYLKKAAAVAAAGVLVLSLAACGQSGKTESKAESQAAESAATESTAEAEKPGVVGGWTINKGDMLPAANADAIAAYEKVSGELPGASEPVAVIATQVVAGTNYCIMVRERAEGEEAASALSLVYIYQDLSGNASILQKTAVTEDGLLGGFKVNEEELAFGADETVKNAFEKATETLLGVNYEPIAYLAKQIVSGSNYMVLCRTTVVSPDAVPEFALVTIYEDLQGNAKFGESEPLRIGLN